MDKTKQVRKLKLCASIIALLLILAGCDNVINNIQSDSISFGDITFREIPGITEEEIEAIEELQRQGLSFVYGMPFSTEAFSGEDGIVKGFAALFADWLSNVFEIPFIPEHHEWLPLLAALTEGEVDFSGEVTATEARRSLFFMTNPIVERPLKYFRIENSIPLREIAAARRATGGRLRYGFITGTMTHNTVVAGSDPDAFEIVFIDHLDGVHEALLSNHIDAFFYSGPVEASFDHYGDVVSEYFLPLVYIPVSLVASRQRPELEPIITAVDKILQNGGLRYLTELYNLGHNEYLRHKLHMRLTDEEISFIQNSSVIPFVSDADNYPIGFYHSHYGIWRGIAFDIIAEMEALTDLRFDLINDQNADWSDLLAMLRDGRALMSTELIRTSDREGQFLWPSNSIISNQYALLSRAEYPDIRINEIAFTRVGLIRDSAYAAVFQHWFPNHMYTVIYDGTDGAFNALEIGEVDMVMSSVIQLLTMTHFRELPGFKANIVFNSTFNSTFGFNVNEDILVSIVDKALSIIDVDIISGRWIRRTYDYRLAFVEARRLWNNLAAAALVVILIFMIAAYLRDRRKRKTIMQQTSVLSAIYESIPGIVFTKDKNGFYTSCNHLFGELAGADPNDIIGKHPNDIKSLAILALEGFDELDKKVINENTSIRTEGWYTLPNNTRIASEIIKAPLIMNGKVEGALSIANDITKRKMAEEEAGRMSQRIEAIINNLPGMVFQQIYNPPEYTFTFVSDGCMDLLGYTSEEMLDGKIKFFDMVHEDDVEDIEKQSSRTIPFGLPFEAFFRIKTREGNEKWIWERSRVIEKNPDGSPYLVEGYYEDITEQRQLEAAEHANRAKTEFLAKMSHEIRTPMNSIMGFAELATDSESVPEVKSYLEKIIDSTKWLLRIINDILDISKIEAGKMELERVPFDLHDVFSRCQSVILPGIKEKGLDLSVYAEPSSGRKLLGDPLRLYQVLMNLLSNAVKFTDSGTIKFSSSIKDVNESKTTVYFEVKDPGIGMSIEQINKVFDAFTQADSSTTREYGGTGLGLPIAKSIVELMNGELKADSTVGVGSIFSFELTFDTILVSDDTQNEKTKYDILEKPYFEGLVLICDDNTMNQEVICAHLARVGLQTVAVANGKAGVEAVQERIRKNEKPFDLIFMDMFMPVMDGMEASSKIMALNTGTPVIAMTANIMTSELEKYKRNGMPDCLGKPFTSYDLWQVLLNYLTPISSDPIYEEEDNEELQRKLRVNFFNNNQNVHDEIANAVALGDIKLGHRLAHSLKGNAGLIGKTALRNAAAEVEMLLKDGIASVWDNKMSSLKAELLAVLDDIQSYLEKSGALEELQGGVKHPALDKEQTVKLFAKLKPMLESDNTDCIELLDEIRSVPGTLELARQIDNFDFKSAAITLAALIKEMES
ncbi:MAG: ATP-binding protein [Treponema sp.]|nr:ATP-binding protein [Treponema sp.]